MTLTEALALGKPLAYMVGTPAHCQTGTCAPGLQFLMNEHERVGDKIVMVHSDVYADNAATEVAPAVNALGVQYEPIITALREIGYDGWLSVEAFDFKPGPEMIARKSIECLRRVTG